MKAKPKISEVLYNRYEYLAKKYASKIYSYEELSYEYEDLVQEFRIKIVTTIKSYGKRWSAYRKGEKPKPVPLRYYLEGACSNKVKDFMKYISRENYKTRIDEISYDYGINNETETVPNKNRFFLNGVNLLEGLTGKERAIFSLYLRGYTNTFLNKVYFNNSKEKEARKEILESGDEPFGVADIINLQREKLIRKYGSELRQSTQVFESYSFED
jgi:hypothetical protein